MSTKRTATKPKTSRPSRPASKPSQSKRKATVRSTPAAERAERGAGRVASADRTRRALIDAGLVLFREHGLDAPSLDAICERAGYTRGAFYVHFEDRDAFIDAVMEQIGLPLLDAVLGDPRTRGAEPSDLEQTVGRFLEAVASGAYPLTGDNGPRPHQLLDACARSERVRSRYVELIRESVERLSAIVQRSQLAGSVRADVDAEAIAWIALAAIVGGQTLLELRAFSNLAGPAMSFVGLVRGPELRPIRSELTAEDLLEAYVDQHNRLVEQAGPDPKVGRSYRGLPASGRARLAALVALFQDDALLRFEGIPLGPLQGRAAIEQALANQRPERPMRLLSSARGVDEDQARGRYADELGTHGTLELTARSGRIARLIITPSCTQSSGRA